MGCLLHVPGLYRVHVPWQVYNLGALSFVPLSFDVPEHTADVDALGTLRLLSAIRMCDLDRTCRLYQVQYLLPHLQP